MNDVNPLVGKYTCSGKQIKFYHAFDNKLTK